MPYMVYFDDAKDWVEECTKQLDNFDKDKGLDKTLDQQGYVYVAYCPRPTSPRLIIQTERFNRSYCTCGDCGIKELYRIRHKVLWAKPKVDNFATLEADDIEQASSSQRIDHMISSATSSAYTTTDRKYETDDDNCGILAVYAGSELHVPVPVRKTTDEPQAPVSRRYWWHTLLC